MQTNKKNREEYEKMWELFREIWKERPHYSEISGRPLGNRINSCFFDHLLEKGTYPHLKLEKDNIILVTKQEHKLKTDGFPLEKHKMYIEKAKKKFLNAE